MLPLSSRVLLALAVTVLSFILRSLAWSHTQPGQLKELLNEQQSDVLVAFVTTSEPKSQRAETEWAKVVADAGDDRDRLVSINCEEHAAFCDVYASEERSGGDSKLSTPFIKLLRPNKDGNVLYRGPRRAAAILHFLRRMRRPAVTLLATDDEKAVFEAIDETVFIAHVPASEQHSRLVESFARVAARRQDEFTFGMVVKTASADQAESPSIVCYHPLESNSRTVDLPTIGELSEDDTLDGALDKRILDASRPIIAELTPYNHQRFLDRAWPMIYIFAETEQERAELRTSLRGFARSYYESLTSVTADPLDFPGLPERLGLGDKDRKREDGQSLYPAGVVHQLSVNRIYPYPLGRALDNRSLQQWGLDVYQGRIAPWTPGGEANKVVRQGTNKKGTTRKVSVAGNWPGGSNVKIKVAGRDEL